MKEVKIESNRVDYNDSIYLYENINLKKKININKKCVKNTIINLICLILFILSFILYIHSLSGCSGNEYDCLTKKYIKYYYRLGIETLVSSILFSIIVAISFISKRRYLIIFYFIPFIIVFSFSLFLILN